MGGSRQVALGDAVQLHGAASWSLIMLAVQALVSVTCAAHGGGGAGSMEAAELHTLAYTPFKHTCGHLSGPFQPSSKMVQTV